MNTLHNWIGWARENWSECLDALLEGGPTVAHQELVAELAYSQPINARIISELENSTPKKVVIILAVFFFAVTGTWSGISNKSRLQNQINTLTAQSLSVSATKSDIASLTAHLDAGFDRVVHAISQKPPTTIRVPDKKPASPSPVHPPVVEHLRFSAKPVASNNPAAPYAVQVIIQTDVTDPACRIRDRYLRSPIVGRKFLCRRWEFGHI